MHHAASAPAIAGAAPGVAPAAPAISFPPGTPLQQMMLQLIAASEYTEHPDQVSGTVKGEGRQDFCKDSVVASLAALP